MKLNNTSSDTVKKIKPPDSHHLKAAEGWLELGNHLEANEELENITASDRAHPDVLELRWQIYIEEEKWEASALIGGVIVELAPERHTGWIYRSFALHRMNQTQEAYDLLYPAAEKFPKIWTVPYNLACYAARLNRIDEAEIWLRKAMTIDQKLTQTTAINDPDLEPLWESMKGTFWKRS
jgi:tetratricopeptide (TPR) repeat protein